MRVGDVGMDMARATRTRSAWLSCQRCHLFRAADRTWSMGGHRQEVRTARKDAVINIGGTRTKHVFVDYFLINILMESSPQSSALEIKWA